MADRKRPLVTIVSGGHQQRVGKWDIELLLLAQPARLAAKCCKLWLSGNFRPIQSMRWLHPNRLDEKFSYGEDVTLKVESLDSFDFSTADLALFSAGGDTAKAHAPRQVRQAVL